MKYIFVNPEKIYMCLLVSIEGSKFISNLSSWNIYLATLWKFTCGFFSSRDNGLKGRSYESNANYPTYSDHVQVIDSMSQQLNQAYKSIEVEAMTAIRHLEFVAELGFDRVVVEGDLSIVMNGLKTSLSSYGLLISDVCTFENLFSRLFYSHVKREDNKVAQYLAKLVVNYPDNVIWMEDVPPLVFSFVQVDLATVLE